jgi:hypothetical protein
MAVVGVEGVEIACPATSSAAQGKKFCKPALLGRLSDGLIHQQDGNAVPNRVCAMALTALQGLAFVRQSKRPLANWTNQNVEQILRNHLI